MIFCLLGSYMVSSAGFLSFFIRIPPIPILSFGVYLFLFSCLYLASREVFPVALVLFINYLFIVSTPPPSLNFVFFLCLIFLIILCLFWWPFVICLVGVVFFLFILWIHSSTIVTHDYSFHISWWCCNLPLQYTIIVILKIWITGYCSGLCHRNGIGCISCNVLLIFFRFFPFLFPDHLLLWLVQDHDILDQFFVSGFCLDYVVRYLYFYHIIMLIPFPLLSFLGCWVQIWDTIEPLSFTKELCPT